MNKLSKVKNIIVNGPQKLDCGKEISNFPIAYETYGNLNDQKDNAILIFHALTGDQFAAGKNPITNNGVILSLRKSAPAKIAVRGLNPLQTAACVGDIILRANPHK